MIEIAMKDADFQKKIYAIAARLPEQEAVPYSFEQRIMAHLKSTPFIDPRTAVGRVLWRAVIPCIAITFITGFIALGLENDGPDLESAVLAPINMAEESW